MMMVDGAIQILFWDEFLFGPKLAAAAARGTDPRRPAGPREFLVSNN